MTLEIPDDQWAELEARARASGCEKVERLIGDALEEYLLLDTGQFASAADAPATSPPGYGVLDDQRADELRQHVRELRGAWRAPD